MKHLSGILIVLSLLVSCATELPEAVEALLVPSVDLERYAGLWYQVGRYPHFFQSDDCAESTAEYTLREDGKIEVLNRCWEEVYGGDYRQQVRAVGTPINEGGSQLRVVFFGLFPANYLIIELDTEEYRWAVVTTPDRDTLWILSREPALEPALFTGIVESLAEKGFDPEKILRTSRQL